MYEKQLREVGKLIANSENINTGVPQLSNLGPSFSPHQGGLTQIKLPFDSYRSHAHVLSLPETIWMPQRTFRRYRNVFSLDAHVVLCPRRAITRFKLCRNSDVSIVVKHFKMQCLCQNTCIDYKINFSILFLSISSSSGVLWNQRPLLPTLRSFSPIIW